MTKLNGDTTMSAVEGGQIAVRGESYVGRWLHDPMEWGRGQIRPRPEYATSDHQSKLAELVVGSLVEVTSEERAYSSCTDGRIPLGLESGEPVPVREQLVGADVMTAFHMGEALGEYFHRDPIAPIADRLWATVTHLKEYGVLAAAHWPCGGADGYHSVNANLVDLTRLDVFNARQQELLPSGVYHQATREQLRAGYRQRHTEDAYETWSSQLVLAAVRKINGHRAIAQHYDDGRGVHGHVEEQIVRVQVEGVAIDEHAIRRGTSGRQVFGVNDLRIARLAGIMGGDDPELVRLAHMAGEDFTDGGHGTLARDLPTLVIEKSSPSPAAVTEPQALVR